MNITQVSYGKTINIGNYQSIRIEFRADLLPGESLAETIERLKKILDKEETLILRENGFIAK